MPRKKKTMSEDDKRLVELAKYQTDGKNYNKHGVKTLDELLGEKSIPYEHKTKEEYIDYLENLSVFDLQEHAVSVSVLPRDDRFQLIANLIKRYEEVTSPYFNAVEVQPVKLKFSPEALRILAEGR